MPSPVPFDNCKTFKCPGIVVRGKPSQVLEMFKSGPSPLAQDRIGPVLVLSSHRLTLGWEGEFVEKHDERQRVIFYRVAQGNL